MVALHRWLRFFVDGDPVVLRVPDDGQVQVQPLKRFFIVAARRQHIFMPQNIPRSPKSSEAQDLLNEEDRVWLAERLVEYRELLEYLHSH